jgi:tellurite methyltransferase
MSYDYNALYAEMPDALGAPSPAFVKFFQEYKGPALRVLDIGCGQGRDALFIARLGHTVVGVDMASAGIAQLNAAAKAEGLPIIGEVANIITYEPDGQFDILLIDRTLHMLLDSDERHACFATLLNHLSPGGTLLLADEPINMLGLRAVMEATGRHWNIITNKGGLLFAQG